MTRPQVLLVGHTSDEHCDYLERLFNERDDVTVLRTSLASLPRESFAWEVSGNGSLGSAKCAGGAATSGIWRRPGQADVSQYHREFAAFVDAECRDAFRGWLETAQINWLTRPRTFETAELKLVQLATARRLGIAIPATTVTNSAERATRFAESYPEVVAKAVRYGAVSSERPLMAWTSVRSIEELSRLDGPPVILQERVKAAAHLRVTTVQRETFISEMRTDLIDWRSELSNHEAFKAVDLDSYPQVALGAQLIASRLLLGLSAQDWMIDAEGNCVFVEANPNGQWLFLESAHGGAIGQAVMQALISLARSADLHEP